MEDEPLRKSPVKARTTGHAQGGGAQVQDLAVLRRRRPNCKSGCEKKVLSFFSSWRSRQVTESKDFFFFLRQSSLFLGANRKPHTPKWPFPSPSSPRRRSLNRRPVLVWTGRMLQGWFGKERSESFLPFFLFPFQSLDSAIRNWFIVAATLRI